MGEHGAVENGAGAAAVHESAAVDPHDHRQFCRVPRWCPDVEVQAILARRGAARRGIAGGEYLHAIVAEAERRPHAGPRLDGLRRPPAQRPQRWRGEWNALEDIEAVVLHAANAARRDLHHRRGGRRSQARWDDEECCGDYRERNPGKNPHGVPPWFGCLHTDVCCDHGATRVNLFVSFKAASNRERWCR